MTELAESIREFLEEGIRPVTYEEVIRLSLSDLIPDAVVRDDAATRSLLDAAVREALVISPIGSGAWFGCASSSTMAQIRTIEEVDEEFEAVLAIGREKGRLTQDELVESLESVEWTPEVLTALIDRVTSEGVELVVEEEELAVGVVVVRDQPAQAPNGVTRSGTKRSNGRARGLCRRNRWQRWRIP